MLFPAAYWLIYDSLKKLHDIFIISINENRHREFHTWANTHIDSVPLIPHRKLTPICNAVSHLSVNDPIEYRLTEFLLALKTVAQYSENDCEVNIVRDSILLTYKSLVLQAEYLGIFPVDFAERLKEIDLQIKDIKRRLRETCREIKRLRKLKSPQKRYLNSLIKVRKKTFKERENAFRHRKIILQMSKNPLIY